MTGRSRKPLLNTAMIAATAVVVAVSAWIIIVHAISPAV